MKSFIAILCLSLFLSASLYSQVEEGTPEIIRGDEEYTLIVRTENADDSKAIEGVEVYLYETLEDKFLTSGTTVDGQVTFPIEPSVEYEVRTCHPDFLRNGLSIFECNEGDEVFCSIGGSYYNYASTGGKDKPIAFFTAALSMTNIKVGSVFELDNVYYDLDKATLREEGKAELRELYKIMKRNESITIELSSHTDSRASDEYNTDLSQRRAESCLNYLASLGISTSRIRAKGYGESQLVNNCADGIDCTEKQHQRNRRTVIEVLSFEKVDCAPSLDVDFKPKDLRNDLEDGRIINKK